MERDEFEIMIQTALDQLAADLLDDVSTGRAPRRRPLPSLTIGEARKEVGEAVRRLATAGRTSNALAVPDPEWLPPCF